MALQIARAFNALIRSVYPCVQVRERVQRIEHFFQSDPRKIILRSLTGLCISVSSKPSSAVERWITNSGTMSCREYLDRGECERKSGNHGIVQCYRLGSSIGSTNSVKF